MTFTVWRATYFETEVYMQVCIQNYILSPLFIRVNIDFNLTLTQSFDLIMWFLERIPLMGSSTVMNLSVLSHKLISKTVHQTTTGHGLSWEESGLAARAKNLVWRKSRPKQKLGLNRWKQNSMIFRYFLNDFNTVVGFELESLLTENCRHVRFNLSYLNIPCIKCYADSIYCMSRFLLWTEFYNFYGP